MTEGKPEPLIPNEIHEKIMAYLASAEGDYVRTLRAFIVEQRLLNAESAA